MRRSLILFLLISLLCLGAVPSSEARTPRFGINTLKNTLPNGEYTVQVHRNGSWARAGSISCDRFFRTQQIDLPLHSLKNEPLRIRIVQSGGGAAHLDAVLLGGWPPVRVDGRTGFMVGKLSRTDMDVIDSYGRTLEIEFPAGSTGPLTICGRVESLHISREPFLFPLVNLATEISAHSAFYTYHPETIAGGDAFFKEFAHAGSGHPSGYTYGYLTEDNKNLYITLDFTADNTRDGDKDYASVYVRTSGGCKEFKVSEANNEWGRVSFTYTDKVEYQHKVYDFVIPLSDLPRERPLQLAFAAYGTATPAGHHFPAAAYDPVNDRYLVVFYDTDGSTGHVWGQFVNANGSPDGSYIQVTEQSGYGSPPAIAYDTVNQRFLVVAGNNITTSQDIVGQLVNADGSLSGGNFIISNAASVQTFPAVAFDPVSSRYLAAWRDYRNSVYEVYGQIVNADGSLTGSNFSLFSIGTSYDPDVAYDSVNQRFLVVCHLSDINYDIVGQLVSPAGTLLGSNFYITNDAASQYGASAAFDPVNQRFLVAWEGASGPAPSDVSARLVNADGSLPGSIFTIGGGANADSLVSVLYNKRRQDYVAAWQYEVSTGIWSVTGHHLLPDGTLSGSQFTIGSGTDGGGPSNNAIGTAYNSSCGNELVVWDTNLHDITWEIQRGCAYNLDVSVLPSTGGTVTGTGIDCPGDCQEAGIEAGTAMTLTATPATGYLFGNWSGDLSSTENPLNFTLDMDKSLEAVFVQSVSGSQSSVSLPAGTAAADYRIVSIPVQPDSEGDERSLFAGLEIGSYDPAMMRIGHWDADGQSYLEYPFDQQIIPGWAGWFLFRNGMTLNFQGSPTQTSIGPNGQAGYGYDIHEGWNQLGNPYTFPVSVADFWAENGVDHEPFSAGTLTQGIFWVWEGGAYLQGSVLAAGQGGWVKKTSTGIGHIFFPSVQASAAADPSARPAPEDLEQPPGPPSALIGNAEGSSGGGSGGGCFVETTRLP